MTNAEPGAYADITGPRSVRIERLLPGPIDRAWEWLTDGELRRQWLAAGDMRLEVGAPFELVWRNDELSDPPGRRPEGFAEEHRMQSRILEVDAPRRLAFSWGDGEVVFELEPRGERVLLRVLHHGIPDRSNMLLVGAGWHMHLDILGARVRGEAPASFWEGWTRLRGEYERRIPA